MNKKSKKEALTKQNENLRRHLEDLNKVAEGISQYDAFIINAVSQYENTYPKIISKNGHRIKRNNEGRRLSLSRIVNNRLNHIDECVTRRVSKQKFFVHEKERLGRQKKQTEEWYAFAYLAKTSRSKNTLKIESEHKLKKEHAMSTITRAVFHSIDGRPISGTYFLISPTFGKIFIRNDINEIITSRTFLLQVWQMLTEFGLMQFDEKPSTPLWLVNMFNSRGHGIFQQKLGIRVEPSEFISISSRASPDQAYSAPAGPSVQRPPGRPHVGWRGLSAWFDQSLKSSKDDGGLCYDLDLDRFDDFKNSIQMPIERAWQSVIRSNRKLGELRAELISPGETIGDIIAA